jgi:LAGLIDADG-like domain
MYVIIVNSHYLPKDGNFMGIENNRLFGLTNLQVFPRITESREDSKDNMESFDVPQTIQVLSTENNKLAWKPVTKYSIHKNCKVYSINFSDSSSIQSTLNASVVTLNNELDLVRHVPKVGLVVAKASGIPTRLVPTEVIETFRFPDQAGSIRHRFKDVPVDQRLGIFFGLMIGDGYFSQGRVYIAKTDMVFRDFIQESLNTFTKHPTRTIPVLTENKKRTIGGKSYDYQVHQFSSILMARCLRNLVGGGAENKHLPEFWFHTSEEFRWGLLGGLISSDGCISPRSINFGTCSRVLIYEVLALCASLGLLTKMYVSRHENKRIEYKISIPTKEYEKLKEKLPIISAYKKEQLLALPEEKIPGQQSKAPPLPAHRLLELWDLCKTLGKSGERKAWRQKLDAMTLATAFHIIEIPGFQDLCERKPFWTKWKNWVLDPEIIWVETLSFEELPGITEAYDLTIDPQFIMVGENFHLHGDTATGISRSVTKPLPKLVRCFLLTTCSTYWTSLSGTFRSKRPLWDLMQSLPLTKLSLSTPLTLWKMLRKLMRTSKLQSMITSRLKRSSTIPLKSINFLLLSGGVFCVIF